MLLLNTALTVKAGAAGSHSNKGWEEFTDRVIDVVDRFGGANLASGGGAAASALAGRGRGIVFLAWGAWAAKRVAKLDKVCCTPFPRCPLPFYAFLARTGRHRRLMLTNFSPSPPLPRPAVLGQTSYTHERRT